MYDRVFFYTARINFILDGTISKCSKIGIVRNREKNKASTSAVHVSSSKWIFLIIGIEKKNVSISAVHVSKSKLETKPKISSTHCTKLVLPGTNIQIFRV